MIRTSLLALIACLLTVACERERSFDDPSFEIEAQNRMEPSEWTQMITVHGYADNRVMCTEILNAMVAAKIDPGFLGQPNLRCVPVQ